MATQRTPFVHSPDSGEYPSSGGRRSFLGFCLALAGAAFAALAAVPLSRFILYPLYAPGLDGKWIDLGSTTDFAVHDPIRKVVDVEHLDGWEKTVSRETVYVTHDLDGSLRVLSAVCPHLGCSIAWNSGSGTFVCPCHGGCFTKSGSRISGPPPRNMTALDSKATDGRLVVRYQTPSA